MAISIIWVLFQNHLTALFLDNKLINESAGLHFCLAVLLLFELVRCFWIVFLHEPVIVLVTVIKFLSLVGLILLHIAIVVLLGLARVN